MKEYELKKYLGKDYNGGDMFTYFVTNNLIEAIVWFFKGYKFTKTK